MDTKIDQNKATLEKVPAMAMSKNMPYKKLAVVISINAVIMFLLTYAMIDRFDHFYANINRVYMAVMMVAPMVILMLLVMGSMYNNKRLNYALIACLLYTSDAADERSSVDLGGRRIIKKKNSVTLRGPHMLLLQTSCIRISTSLVNPHFVY